MAADYESREQAATADRTLAEQITRAWDGFHKADGVEMKRIEYARQIQNREIKAPVPDHIATGRAVFSINLPHAVETPSETLNLATQKWPVYRRYATGIEVRPQEISTRIEQAANTGVKKLYAYREAGDLILNEGQAYVTVTPERAHFEKARDYYDVDSMLTEREYAKLTPSEKKLYVEDNDAQSSRRYGIPDKRYQRDSKGRPSTHPYYEGSDREFVYSREPTSEAYLKDLKRHRGSKLPLSMRVWSRQDVAPIGRRFEGDTVELDGMVTRQTFTRSALFRRGYRWGDNLEMLVDDLDGDATLFTWWYYDAKGCPTVAYSIDGLPTWKRKKTATGEDLADAVIDLRRECRLTRLPIACAFGWHTADRDIQKRSLPFAWVFGPGWLAADAIASGLTYQMWATGFSGKAFTVDDRGDLDDFQADLERNRPGFPRNVLQTSPGAITLLPKGHLFDLSTPVANDAGHKLMQSLVGIEESASKGEGASADASGWARNVMSAQVQQGLAQIKDGMLSLYSQVGSLFLETMTRHAEVYGPVKMAVPTPVPVASTEKSPTRTVLEFTESLCGEMFDIESEYEITFGENLAQNAQAMEMAKNRMIPYRKALELIGDPSPESTEAEIMAEDERRTPQGQARIRALAARIVGDEEEAARLQAVADGEVDENGEPTGAAAGLQGQQQAAPDGGGATGVSSPDPGQAQLASVVGAAHQTGPMNQAAQLASTTGTQMPVASVNGAGGL